MKQKKIKKTLYIVYRIEDGYIERYCDTLKEAKGFIGENESDIPHCGTCACESGYAIKKLEFNLE